MQLEQMEQAISTFAKKYSEDIGEPLRVPITLNTRDEGIRVTHQSVEVSVQVILEGVDLRELVERIIHLVDELFEKAKEERRRIIEREKKLAAAHIHELQRFCTIDEFNEWLATFKLGPLIYTKGDAKA